MDTPFNFVVYSFSKCPSNWGRFNLTPMRVFTNYIADSFAQAGSLSPIEIAFLDDKRLTFDKGKQIERIEFHSLDEKLRLLITMFVPSFDFGNAVWSRLMAFKDLRDSLVHPKRNDDEIDIVAYQNNVSIGLAAVIEIMNCLSQGIFRKPLRKRLLDLIPD
ncbi:MAG: hypothetical protein ABSG75_10035 [Syntrophales bacterium]